MRYHQRRFLTLFIIVALLIIVALVYYFIQFQNPRNALSLIPTAQAQEVSVEKITDFNSAVQINSDNTVTVTETIQYDFGTGQKHGIYRNIPYRYQTKLGNFTVGIKAQSVTNENNQPYKYTALNQGNQLSIKIGDANQLVSGFKTYIITYTLNRVINFFNDHDEFYWNVTGNEWQVPIERSGIIVKLPANVAAADLQAECFTGVLGSQEQNCQVTNVTNSQVGYTAFNTLEPGQGLTVVFGFPKGILHKPSAIQNLTWIIQDNWIIFLPLITLLIMMLLWYVHGRNLGKKRTIIPEYEAPNNLTPLEVGTLIDERIDPRDLSATIINLAVKGYIKIKSLDKINKSWFQKKFDWELSKLKNFDSIKPLEKEFIADVFDGKDSVKISQLKSRFAARLQKLQLKMYQQFADDGYFSQSPSKVRNTYLFAGMVFLGIVIFIYGTFFFDRNPITIFSIFISALMIIIVGRIMPRKTVLGTELYQKIKGYKLYLSVAEKDRLNFHNAPAKTPEVFEKHLPYAMSLGVEKEWAKEFKDIYREQPDWYEGNIGTFNTFIFVNSLNSFSQQTRGALHYQSAAASGNSGFGGGGSSGGGFGGGGGGSW